MKHQTPHAESPVISQARGRATKMRSLAAGLLVGGVFLWLAVKNLDFGLVVEALRRAELSYAWPLLSLLFLFYLLKALRWRMLIHESYGVTAGRLARPMMIGFAANNLLPFRVGEIVRVLYASSAVELPKAYLLASIVVERFFDFIGVALLASAALVALAMTESSSGTETIMQAVSAGILVVAGGALVVMSRMRGQHLLPVLRIVPERFQAPARDMLSRFQHGARAMFDNRSLIKVLLNSIVQWGAMAGCIFLALEAFGINLPVAASAFLLGLIVLGIALPSSPGYIGTIEFTFVYGLGLFEVAPNDAFACALFYHILTFGFVTLAGLACLLGARQN